MSIRAQHRLFCLPCRRPLSYDSDIARIAAILRVASPENLDFARVHRLAKQCLQSKVPNGFRATYSFHPDFLGNALELAILYDIEPVNLFPRYPYPELTPHRYRNAFFTT